MRKRLQLLTSLIFVLLFSDLNAQINVVNEGILTIKVGQLVHINGNFSNYAALLLNDGDFRLTGNFLNEVGVVNPGEWHLSFYRF